MSGIENPFEKSISEVVKLLRENWVSRFRKEGYDNVADELERMDDDMLHQLKDEPAIDFLKKKSPNNHCDVYLEAMQGDFYHKIKGHKMESRQKRLK